MQRFLLYTHTLRHLEWHQVPARLRLRAKRWAREQAPAVARRRRLSQLSGPLAASPAFRLEVPTHPSPDALQRCADLERGRWTFLSESAQLGRVPDWQASAQSQLWRYHLHYFDDILPLVECGDDGRRLARALVEDWIARVPCGLPTARDAWHPYVVSLRLVNWLLALAAVPEVFGDSDAIDASLREQSVFVADNLERDVGGNHLLKNLKAVAIAAVHWRTWVPVEQAVDEFARELEAQTLLDGVHYERSPMYHCQVLADALEVAAVLFAAGRGVPARLAHACARLQGALPRLTHPDGDIALLGDSAFGMATSVRELEALYEVLSGRTAPTPLSPRHRVFSALAAGTAALPARTVYADGPGPLPVHAAAHGRMHSGIVKRQAGTITLVTDVGAVCPDELPAHAQADTFTFELSAGATRVIVDAGVSEYRDGTWRRYARSTAAHNTVTVDATDSTECWGSFRAARRARIVDARTGAQDGWQWIDATHDGYRRLAGPVDHRRRFLLHDEGVLLVSDWLHGAGAHGWAVHLHLHPEVQVEHPDGGGARLRRGTSVLRLAWHGLEAPAVIAGVTSPAQGWYSEHFGERRPAPVLVWTGNGPLPVTWTIAVVSERAQSPFHAVTLAPDGDLLIDGRRLEAPRLAPPGR